jgi:hypothetical protein
MAGLRRILLVLGLGVMALVVLHPPWIAKAVLTRMSFRGFPSVPPTTIIDSATWRVPFAAVYSPPTLDLPVGDLAEYQRRLLAGDTAAASEWQGRTEAIERRYRVPPKLRSVWGRDTRAVAFTSSIVSTRFEIDRVRLGIYLLAIAVATMAILRRFR